MDGGKEDDDTYMEVWVHDGCMKCESFMCINSRGRFILAELGFLCSFIVNQAGQTDKCFKWRRKIQWLFVLGQVTNACLFHSCPFSHQVIVERHTLYMRDAYVKWIMHCRTADTERHSLFAWGATSQLFRDTDLDICLISSPHGRVSLWHGEKEVTITWRQELSVKGVT